MIRKYFLPTTDTSTLYFPEYGKILKVGEQNGELYVWVMGTRQTLVPHTFRIFGTGHTLPEDEDLTHLDTVFVKPFVWHIFLKHN